LQRILEPGQIEAQASRSVPRIRLADRNTLFTRRATRLRQLAAHSSVAGYLGLMSRLAEAQHALVARVAVPIPDASQLEAARAHRMPVAPALGSARDPGWHAVLAELLRAVLADGDFPPAVAAACRGLTARPAADLEAEAAALLAAEYARVDVATAPFIMSALQVQWVAVASRLPSADLGPAESPGVCPVCGTLPVASVVRTGAPYSGYRYLHCALCATEWHRVRVECTACGATRGISYHSIEGGSAAIRAESCDGCFGYRKIFYQEHEPEVDPVADDLASVALDLLLTEAGFHRASGNPLLFAREA
jgi:FdhE protein